MNIYSDIKKLESGVYKIGDASIVKFGGKIGFKIITINDDNSCIFVQLHLLHEKRTPGEEVSPKDINEGFNICLCFDNVESINATICALYEAKCILLSKEENKN